MKSVILYVILCLSLVLSGCSAGQAAPSSTPSTATEVDPTQAQSTELFAMDTVMTLTAYGPNANPALQAAAEEIQRLDKLLSISSESGEILPLNQSGHGELSDETAALLQRALEVSRETGGLFDCTIGPVMDAWGFPTQNYQVPEGGLLQSLLARVDYRQVALSDHTVTLPKGVEIDLGGIAKGYTSDHIMDGFAQSGITSGIVSLGGNVQTLGRKPDGSLWRVGLQDPRNPDQTFAVVEVEDQAVITSGGYQRYFQEDGVTYHHIIDPRTGYPADSGIISATIVSADGTLADALSTALFIMGPEEAETFWQAHQDRFDAILMTDSGQILVTAGLAQRCQITTDDAVRVIQ